MVINDGRDAFLAQQCMSIARLLLGLSKKICTWGLWTTIRVVWLNLERCTRRAKSVKRFTAARSLHFSLYDHLNVILMSHQVMFAGALFFFHFCISSVCVSVCSIHESFKKWASITRLYHATDENGPTWCTLNLNMAYLSCQRRMTTEGFETHYARQRHHCTTRTKLTAQLSSALLTLSCS